MYRIATFMSLGSVRRSVGVSVLLLLLLCGVPTPATASGVPSVMQFGKESESNTGNVILWDEGDSAVYVGGDTYGDLFKTRGTGSGSGRYTQEAFVTKYQTSPGRNAGVGAMSWGQQWSGSSDGDSVTALASYGDMVFAAGTTYGSFHGQHQGKKDIFVMCLDGKDSTLIWGIQIGSNEDDWVGAMSADSTGLYIGGMTKGSFYDANSGGTDVILIKVNLKTGGLVWSKQFGTTSVDTVTSIKVLTPTTLQVDGSSQMLFSPPKNGYSAIYDSISGDLLTGSSMYDYNMGIKLSTTGRHAAYLLSTEPGPNYPGSVVEIITNPCPGGTILNAVKGGYSKSTPFYSDLSCQPCSSGYSSPYSVKCQRCPSGSHPIDSATKCAECPAGTYAVSQLCIECPWLQWSESGTSWACPYYKWPLFMDTTSVVIVTLIMLVSVLVVTFRLLHLTPGMRGVIILSTMNALLDQLFIFTAVFDKRLYLIFCTIFVFLPILFYIYYVLRLCDPTKPFRPRQLMPRPRFLTHIWHLSIVNGVPQWDNVPYYAPVVPTEVSSTPALVTEGVVPNEGDQVVILNHIDDSSGESGIGGGESRENGESDENGDNGKIENNGGNGEGGGPDDSDRIDDTGSKVFSIELCGLTAQIIGVWLKATLKQFLFICVWIPVHIVYLTPWYALHFLFYLAGFFTGFYLFQFKLLHVKKVGVLWFEIMLSGKSSALVMEVVGKVESDFDVRDVNKSILAEGLLQACPQYIVQLLNIVNLHQRDLLPLASLVTSGSFVVYQIFRIIYWHVWQRMDLFDMPILWVFSGEEEISAALERYAIEADLRFDGSESSRESDSGDSESSPLVLKYEEKALEMTALLDTQKAVNRRLVEEQEVMMRKLLQLEGIILSEKDTQPSSIEARDVKVDDFEDNTMCNDSNDEGSDVDLV